MYRVELKGQLSADRPQALPTTVPNVPCGVESHYLYSLIKCLKRLFLMYRVELKVSLQEFFYIVV